MDLIFLETELHIARPPKHCSHYDMFYLEIVCVIESWCWNFCFFLSKWNVMSKYIIFLKFLLFKPYFNRLCCQSSCCGGILTIISKRLPYHPHLKPWLPITTFYHFNQTQNLANQPTQPNMKSGYHQPGGCGYPQPLFHNHWTKHTLSDGMTNVQHLHKLLTNS